ncbi:MAG TPA: hypothetical protein VFS26_04660, partial [Solirubrobacterales bacterium]|nr:hypothetical protein [Solirubrobacterales bacterium]
AGERVHGYVEGAQAHTVCELCVARAERLGWRPASEAEPERASAPHGGRGRLSGLLRGRARRPSPPAAPPASLPQADPAAAPKRTRPAPSPDAHGPNPSERAVARFNGSEAGRTVAGLRRTLGQPWVSVGALAGVPDEVRITVAWELSWYQWGVDTGDELRPVFAIDKGQEIDQLDHAARQWNATVTEDGKVSLGASLVG